MTRQTVKSLSSEMEITKDFLINKCAELEFRLDAVIDRLEHFIEQTVRTVDYLDRRLEEVSEYAEINQG